MRSHATGAACALLLGCAAAAPAAAQQQDSLPRPSHSVAVTVAGQNAIEVWQRLSPRVEAGLALDGLAQREHVGGGGTRQTILKAGPQLKVYAGPPSAVRPFAFVSAMYGRQRYQYGDDAQPATDRRTRVEGTLGVGLEWAPVRRISIGGFTGLTGAKEWIASSMPVSPGVTDTSRANNHSLSTAQSGVRVQLYF